MASVVDHLSLSHSMRVVASLVQELPSRHTENNSLEEEEEDEQFIDHDHLVFVLESVMKIDQFGIPQFVHCVDFLADLSIWNQMRVSPLTVSFSDS